MSTSIRTFIFAAAVSIMQHSSHAQSFTNLNFESANLPILAPGEPGGFVPAANAMPGWSVFIGNEESPVVLYNTPTFGSAAVWIVGPNFQFLPIGPFPALQGRFGAYLTSGLGGSPNPLSASISQTGLVPAGMASIQARINGNPPSVSLNGTEIMMFPISSGPGYTVYGGDVSAFSGQVSTLRFSALPTPEEPFRGFRLDAITFSPLPVPEPGVIALAAIGAGLLGIRRWRNSRNRT